MDFVGQKLAESLILWVVLLGAGIGFLLGYTLESYKTMMQVYALGCVLAAILALPDWFFFNQNPVTWLPSIQKREEQRRKDKKAAKTTTGGEASSATAADAKKNKTKK
uniref:Signal peptidase complex subunit 1 n=1 Tax=Pycnococcus provasolii TaxID=41880 RepID=A0A7S2F5X1_9CHLO|mmetsp:Transcript_2189/g.4944  ORF Transcript_2189/g.4944 Transcript_2189/m.4944 type:complete len:108 (+) Transcript_2189:101-424(+)|eukprot:CAMPEP_0198720908 /NCGR_PEP_ID=MMETSP1471-20131121/64609_1 /TAXON_ID=41880 /ORGANISM="Pycnococcus provasolii, Strain RCC733" /LENGTH=107 /DNA_ID=CAMNT_0044481779 /DNA_START=90 /DNA_END=413 /DNA_ORIENTATION=+